VQLDSAHPERWLIEAASLGRFRRSMEGHGAVDLDRLIELMNEAHEVDTEGLARLALLLHLFLLDSQRRPTRRARWERGLAAVDRLFARLRVPLLGAKKRALRARWDGLLGSLSGVLAGISPSSPPITLWLLGYYPHSVDDRKWNLLEQRLAVFSTQPPSDEIGQLACWLAARELLQMAVSEERADRVTQALRHYKLYISGRYAHAVGKGSLSAVVESDLLDLVTKYPEFLDIEEKERSFFENWLLARFAMHTALRIAFNGPRSRWWWTAFAVAVPLTIAVVGLLLLSDGNFPDGSWLQSSRSWIALGCVGIPVVLSIAKPRVSRALYPRLFAGAILGWSTLLGELGTHRLFAHKEEMGRLEFPQRLCDGKEPTDWLLVVILLVVPFLFLWVEAQAALVSRRLTAVRTTGVLLWALFLVGLVGGLASVGLEHMLCVKAPVPAGRLALFVGGCMVALYLTVVVHLVWGDEGMSATLAHEGRNQG